MPPPAELVMNSIAFVKNSDEPEYWFPFRGQGRDDLRNTNAAPSEVVMNSIAFVKNSDDD